MPRQRQSNTKTPKNLEELSEVYIQGMAEDFISECEKLLPNSVQTLADEVVITTDSNSFTVNFGKTFDPILLPSKYAGESVFQARGLSPNTGAPYGYSADTRQHTRRTKRGITKVMAHTKYYGLGYKPVEGRGGKWYTASPENNFGLRMAQLKIQRSFVQDAWNKVYRKIPKEIRNQLPKAIQIKE